MLKTQRNFELAHSIDCFYSGGKVVVSKDLLITANGENVEISRNGKIIQTLKGDSELITSFALRPNLSQLVTASRSLQLTLWDLESGKTIRSWKAHQAPVTSMEFDPSGTLLATGSADSVIFCWDIDKSICTHHLKGHSGIISALKFHHDADRWTLFSGADDTNVRVWDLLTKECLAVFNGHTSVIRGLDTSPCGWFLISAARDQVVHLWDLRKLSLVNTVPVFEFLETVGFIKKDALPDALAQQADYFIFTGGEKGIIRLWDPFSGNCILSQKKAAHLKHSLITVLLQQDDLIAVTSDYNFLFYSLSSTLARTKQLVGYNDEVIDISFIGPQKQKIAVVTNSEQIRIFDILTGDCDIIYGHSDTILAMDQSIDGQYIATASKDKSAIIWKVDEKWNSIGKCIGHAEAIGAIAFAKKKKYLYTGSQDRTVKKWNLSTCTENGFSSEFTVKVHDKDINSLSVSPNDEWFATASQDRTAKLWNAETGELISTFKGHRRGVWSVQFSPTEHLLATSSGDKTIKIWSLTDMTCLKTFEGHTNSVLRLQYFNFGTQLASVGSDGLLKIWNVKTGECLETKDDHDDKVWALAIREPTESTSCEADSVDFNVTLMATGSGSSTIHFYNDKTQEILDEMHKEAEAKIRNEQDLSNFVAQKDYKSAILMSLKLNQPMRLASLLAQIHNERYISTSSAEPFANAKGEEGLTIDDGSVTGLQSVDDALSELSSSQLSQVLSYIQQWNTNTKFSLTAHRILHLILKNYTMDELLELKDIKNILDAVIPFSERHYSRVNQMLVKSYLMDFTLNEMDSLVDRKRDYDQVGK